MSLPKVSINVQNGGLGRSAQTTDGICGLIVTGIAASGLALGVPKRLTSLADAEALGIVTTVPNLVFARKQIEDYFEQAGQGSVLYIMLVAQTAAQETLVDSTADDSSPLEKLLVFAQGEINLVGLSMGRAAGYTATIANGFDDNISAAALDAQAVADKWIGRYAPFRIILDGAYLDPALAADSWRGGSTFPNVGCFIGTDVAGSRQSCMGRLLGKLAKLPVQRNIGRVKDGPFLATAYLTTGNAVSSYSYAAIEGLHDKGYMLPKIHQGMPGAYLADDPMFADPSNDFSQLSRGRVIDKMIRLTYRTYVSELNDEVEILPNGKLSPSRIAYLESKIERALNDQMVAKGNLSSARCTIDPTQNILSTDRLEVAVYGVPVGTLKEIVVKLGLENPALTANS